VNVVVGAVARTPAWRRIAVVLALGVGVAAAGRIRSCDREPTRPAAIARDGDGVLAAWEVADDDGATLYVRRFAALASGVRTVRAGTPVLRMRGGLTAAPEIASGPDGALVIAKPLVGDEVAIPLDREGTVVGAPQSFRVCRGVLHCAATCRRPVAIGDGYVVGHLVRATNHASGLVELAFLDRAAATVRTVYPPLREQVAHSCATVIAGDRLVVAIGESTFGPTTTLGIQIHHLTLAGAPSRTSWIDGDADVRALVAAGDGVAVLHVRDGRLLVTRVGDDVGATLELPRDIDPASADLGVDARGLYVTWLADRTVHVLALEGKRAHRRQRTGAAPSGTRTVGVGARTATAWTTAGRALQLLTVTR
jgi:hypothetical protein